MNIDPIDWNQFAADVSDIDPDGIYTAGGTYPCPFCGSDDISLTDIEDCKATMVECESCGCRTGRYDNSEDPGWAEREAVGRVRCQEFKRYCSLGTPRFCTGWRRCRIAKR